MTILNARRSHYHISMSHEVTGDTPELYMAVTVQLYTSGVYTAGAGAVTAGWSASPVTRAGAPGPVSWPMSPHVNSCLCFESSMYVHNIIHIHNI